MRSYNRYMIDYVKENLPELFDHMNQDEYNEDIEESMEPPIPIDEKGKEGVYKENYYFRDNLQNPYIHNVLVKAPIRDQIVAFTGRFLDTHSVQLSTSGPVHTFTFGEKEVKPLYELFNLNSDRILELYNGMVDATYYGKISKFFTGWVTNSPHKILLNAMLVDSAQNGYNDIIECCEYMWAFTEYPILFRKYFSTNVREDVMDYTIEHLGSKYKIKQMKNYGELLKYDATTSVDFFIDKLKQGADNVYIDLMYRMRNQFNSKMKNISAEYYKNIETNASQHDNVTVFDDGELADQDGNNSQTAQIIDRTIEKFASKEVNIPMIKIAADGSKVDKSNLAGYIGTIYADSKNNLPKFIEDFIQAYFEKYPSNTSINAAEFLNFGLSLYKSIATSKNETYKEMRSILNYWVDEATPIREHYTREATVIAYTRAIFNYFMLMINYYN